MFAAGEKIDVSQSSPFSFPNFVNQGLVEPIDDLPGAADYIKDFTPFTKQVATINGKTLGLPYFSTVWVWNYYADMMEKLKIDKPFATYDEFIEHCVKAKKDGVSRYPVLWVAGVGLEQLPGTWYQMTWNKRRHLLRQAGQPHAGRRLDRPRDPEMVGQHLREGPRHRRSRNRSKVQFIDSAKAFGAGKNLYRGPNHHYGLNVANDPAQSPIAGKVKVHGSPGDGKTIGVTTSTSCRRPTATRNGRWKLLQYLGGKTKDGNYTQAISLAKDAMLGSGYTSVMNSDAVKQGWAPWGDVPEILKIWDQAAYIGEVCSSVYQPWHFPWTDQLNIEVQKCLTGQITADQCCDNLIKGIADAKRKV